MKTIRILFFIPFCLCILSINAQNVSQSCELFYDTLSQRTVYWGSKEISMSENTLTDSLLKYIKIPNSCCSVSARIVIGFIIEKDGTLTYPRVLNNTLDKIQQCKPFSIILSFFDHLEKWEPQECNDEKVASFYTFYVLLKR